MSGRVLCLCALLSTLATATITFAAETAEDPRHFSEQILLIDENTIISGVPDLEALNANSRGSVLIVDFRDSPEDVAAERAQVHALSMRYENIPIVGANIDPDGLARLTAILANRQPEEMLLLHCSSGNRAAMMWGAYQVEQGRDVTELLDELSPILTKPPARATLSEFAGSAGSDSER